MILDNCSSIALYQVTFYVKQKSACTCKNSSWRAVNFTSQLYLWTLKQEKTVIQRTAVHFHRRNKRVDEQPRNSCAATAIA
mmetsp:Transcript_37217/g.148539  ORF Transcript_37217/g.148539 Transcript_37217/m.148539 type:complete len:81 (-) Transcript_37217:656-898(-)